MIAHRRFIPLAVVLALMVAAWWYYNLASHVSVPVPTSDDPAIAQAIESARVQVKKHPQSAAAHGKLGMVLLVHDYMDAARGYLEKAAELDSSEPLWPYMVALCQTDDPPRTMVWLRKSADLADGDNPVPRLLLGETYLQEGLLGLAADCFQAVTAREVRNQRGLLGLARVHLAREEFELALIQLRKAEKAGPPRKELLTLLSQVHFRQKDLPAAEAALARAASLPDDPPWPDPFREQLAELMVGKQSQLARYAGLQRAGQLAEAMDLGREIGRLHPELVQLATARAARKQKDFVAAERAYRQAIELAPTSSETRYELGEMLREQEKYADASTELRLLVKREPTHGPAQYALGLCAVARGDRAEALTALRAAVALMPSHAAVHRDLAVVLRDEGDKVGALRHLRLAHRLNREDPKSRELLKAMEKGKQP
jgi:tetratricopeptide (TPR) repeat protein